MKKLLSVIIVLAAFGVAARAIKEHFKKINEYKQYKHEYILLKKNKLEN